MVNCPRCQSPNIVSNQPLTQAHFNIAANVARFVQTFGDRRLSALAGLGALGMKGYNSLYRECRCTDCGYVFDIGGDDAAAV